jgi:tetratricopeptide (TPR) repeat protein
MKAVDAKVCPSCGARNKPSWEFCVGCGESLIDVTVVSAAEAKAIAEMAGAAAQSEAPSGPAGPQQSDIPWGTIIGIPIAIVLSVFIYRNINLETARPPSTIFAAPVAPRRSFALAQPGASAASEAKVLSGLSALQAGDLAKALELLEAEASHAPSDARTRHAYAAALWAADQKEKAVREYAAAAQHELAGGTQYALDYARALGTVGQLKESADQYERLLRLKPESSSLANEAARVYVWMGQPQKAVPLLRRAAEASPRETIQVELASALEEAGARGEAEKVYRQILATSAQAEAPRLQLAELLYRSDRAGEAVRAIEEGLAKTPDSPALHKELASLLERSGRTAEAARQYREYARLAPNAGDARELSERAARLDGSKSS